MISILQLQVGKDWVSCKYIVLATNWKPSWNQLKTKHEKQPVLKHCWTGCNKAWALCRNVNISKFKWDQVGRGVVLNDCASFYQTCLWYLVKQSHSLLSISWPEPQHQIDTPPKPPPWNTLPTPGTGSPVPASGSSSHSASPASYSHLLHPINSPQKTLNFKSLFNSNTRGMWLMYFSFSFSFFSPPRWLCSLVLVSLWLFIDHLWSWVYSSWHLSASTLR